MALATLVILAVVVLVGLFVVVSLARTIRVVNQGLVGVVLRLGQFHTVRNPGLTTLIPYADRMVRVDMRETPRTGERIDVITKDNVSLAVLITVFSQVVDPRLALFGVSNYFLAIDQLARTSLRSVMGAMNLDECLSEQALINTRLQATMESVTDKWGIRVNRVQIQEITPPQPILQAMAMQKQAEQEKRAAILRAEGQQQALVTIAEGAKQAAIRQAEGDRQSRILRAEAERQALILRAEGSKEAQALEAEGRAAAISKTYAAIQAQHPTKELIAVLQLDTLGRVASSDNAKVVVPVETAGLLGATSALSSLLGPAASPNGTAPETVVLPASGQPASGSGGHQAGKQ
jgi:regulator of protease activity HflC (stomatin/prohibitin superfamily)